MTITETKTDPDARASRAHDVAIANGDVLNSSLPPNPDSVGLAMFQIERRGAAIKVRFAAGDLYRLVIDAVRVESGGSCNPWLE